MHEVVILADLQRPERVRLPPFLAVHEGSPQGEHCRSAHVLPPFSPILESHGVIASYGQARGQHALYLIGEPPRGTVVIIVPMGDDFSVRLLAPEVSLRSDFRSFRDGDESDSFVFRN